MPHSSAGWHRLPRFVAVKQRAASSLRTGRGGGNDPGESPFPEPGRRIAMIVSIVLGLAMSACATVEPWERGRLAKPQMANGRAPMQDALRAHVYGSREAGAWAGEATGGGCGCY